MKNRIHEAARTIRNQINISPTRKKIIKRMQNSVRNKRAALLIFLASALLLWTYYNSLDLPEWFSDRQMEISFPFFENRSFLIKTTKCRIPNLHPLHQFARQYFLPESYRPCSKLPPLTSVVKTDNTAVVLLNQQAVSFYSYYGVDCCYSIIKRSGSRTDPDRGIQ